MENETLVDLLGLTEEEIRIICDCLINKRLNVIYEQNTPQQQGIILRKVNDLIKKIQNQVEKQIPTIL
jgi:hypothetical protein